jgi:hypothetical protein
MYSYFMYEDKFLAFLEHGRFFFKLNYSIFRPLKKVKIYKCSMERTYIYMNVAVAFWQCASFFICSICIIKKSL